MPSWFNPVLTAVPLFGIAGSAIGYVVKLYLDAGERRRKQFFEILQYIDGSGPIAAKMGAVYSLREFKEHKEFVVRFCQTQRTNVAGGNAASLIDEFDRTAAFFTE